MVEGDCRKVRIGSLLVVKAVIGDVIQFLADPVRRVQGCVGRELEAENASVDAQVQNVVVLALFNTHFIHPAVLHGGDLTLEHAELAVFIDADAAVKPKIDGNKEDQNESNEQDGIVQSRILFKITTMSMVQVQKVEEKVQC